MPESESEYEDVAVQRFEGTVAKVNVDGEVVLSDHLMPGEKTVREVEEEKAEATRDGGSAETVRESLHPEPDSDDPEAEKARQGEDVEGQKASKRAKRAKAEG